MADPRMTNFARILVEHSTQIQPGDRVFIETSTEAMDFTQELYKQIVEKGGRPYLQVEFPEQREIMLGLGAIEEVRKTNELMAYAYEHFESRVRIWSEANTKSLSNIDPKKQSAASEGSAPILKNQFERGAANKFKWVTTLFPTRAYAQEAGMGFEEYTDFVYKAVHAHEKDPIAYWNQVKVDQEKHVQMFAGHDKVELRGPNVDLKLSIKGRTFNNSYGRHNMPDGEIFTGPVENSLQGWVRYTYPALHDGVVVEGAELKFEDGKVAKATARTQEGYLNQMLDTDAGARYVGEFAIGLNRDIDRFTGHILFDEKIGGSFHMALGNGYPETGSKNKSAIHWDMICDLRTDSEIVVDGETVYKDGAFLI
jgi:aminopeptidase